MLIIGLTGSIATGKSSVSAILSSPPYNIPIIDADLLAREVVLPGKASYKKIIAHFGPSILLPQPTTTTITSSSSSSSQPNTTAAAAAPASPQAEIDRAALGRLVFPSTPSARAHRAALNRIIHPAVRRRILTDLLTAYLRGTRAIVLDIPLLFEAGLDPLCGAVLVVGIRDGDVQVARLRGRKVESGNGGGGGESRFLSEAEARDRIASQGSVGWKVSRLEARRVALGEGAGEVLWNDASREDLERAVAGVVGRWKRASPAWWGLLLWGFPPLAIVVAGWWLLRGWWVRRACLRREFLQNEREKEEGKGI